MTIILGDCLDEMKKMEGNSIDFIVTDPPYGISFMGKGWDKGIPSTEYWKEMLRICKPGSMMLCAGLPRMVHRLGCIVEDSGWLIRDMIIHLFGSGFPKSHNHFGFPGYGTALKPAWEGWILAMKPLDGTFAQNADKWGVAGLNIDDSRIGLHGYSQEEWSKKGLSRVTGNSFGEHKPSNSQLPSGRWPANLILSEEAAEELDQQTGITKSTANRRNNRPSKNKCMSGDNLGHISYGHNDSGGASRFFYIAKASSSERNKGLEGMPDKPSYMVENGSKTSGLNGERYERHTTHKNNHPTVKPIALMRYLLKLLAPPGDPIVLDPFAGSGSTLVAAKEIGIRFIGIEKEPEYHAIAEARVKAVKQEEQLELPLT